MPAFGDASHRPAAHSRRVSTALTPPLGLLGERIAARWLMRQGWTLLDHHFRIRRGEIDLVMRRDSDVAFVEVKTRTRTDFGEPIEFVQATKQGRISRTALMWISMFGDPSYVYRFDVIGVTVCGKNVTVQYVENAFMWKSSPRRPRR